MNRMPTLKQLYHLVTLFDYQHFGKAAEACFISQSTMSASIGQLEELLGGQLLERDHKTFIFTPLGKEIVNKSRVLIENARELRDYAQNAGKPMQGILRLGCIPTIAPFIMSDLVSLCHQFYPSLKLLIREDTTEHLLHSLELGQIDLIILALPYPTKNLKTLTLCQDPFQLITSKDGKERFEGKEIDSWPDESIFLLETEHCLTNQTLQACDLKNSKKINPFFATSLHTLIQMVSSGLGVSIFPELAIKSGILAHKNLMTIPLASNAYRELGIAWRATSYKEEDYKLFADLLSKVFENHIK